METCKGDSQYFQYAINYYGYYNDGTNDEETKIVSYVLGALCVIEIIWILKIQFMAVTKLKRIKKYRDTI